MAVHAEGEVESGSHKAGAEDLPERGLRSYAQQDLDGWPKRFARARQFHVAHRASALDAFQGPEAVLLASLKEARRSHPKRECHFVLLQIRRVAFDPHR